MAQSAACVEGAAKWGRGSRLRRPQLRGAQGPAPTAARLGCAAQRGFPCTAALHAGDVSVCATAKRWEWASESRLIASEFITPAGWVSLSFRRGVCRALGSMLRCHLVPLPQTQLFPSAEWHQMSPLHASDAPCPSVPGVGGGSVPTLCPPGPGFCTCGADGDVGLRWGGSQSSAPDMFYLGGGGEVAEQLLQANSDSALLSLSATYLKDGYRRL